jgi:hypothetical protein
MTSGNWVYGYYTLLAGHLDHHEATPETSKGLSQHFPIPVAILARLAVDTGQQGHGIGAGLRHHRSTSAHSSPPLREALLNLPEQQVTAF